VGITPTEIEFESDFSSISQHLSTASFLLPKIVRIRPPEIECEGDLSNLSQ